MGNTLSLKKRTEVFLKYTKKCAYYGIKIDINKMHIDHIISFYIGTTIKERRI